MHALAAVLNMFFINAFFVCEGCEIEKDFAPCIYNIIRAVYYSMKEDSPYVEMALQSIVDCLNKAAKTMKRMPDNLSPREFYHHLRPFLWGYNEGSLKQCGIIFEVKYRA
ncbi:Indoleamine 2,3-dioxygenase 1 [Parelaphostrongylus tenuis]|uniref:Indoleamine 2,3-dioxygenase 1 n=1 Tax=Parelaphostrongylus tenuis TaxID=148309 RepID=A0AAD5QPY9_PARTN|nr:Indoleamine 2,3-dioxygenase 1 [Parelaphostrongylus tenuis]